MTTDTQPSRYRCVATGIEGFIQQVAVSYVRTGHFFYVSGTLGPTADGPAVDTKLIHKYGVDVSRWGRALRKSRGEANLQYIRHDRFFLLMATHGKSLFFELEGDQVSDCRRQPIKFAGYSISYRGGHPHVRIDLETYLGFKAQMVEESLRRDREMLEGMLSLPMFVPYAPVRRQLWHVCREMNRVRSAAGLEPLRQECLSFRRRIVRPFGELGGKAVGVGLVPVPESGLEERDMSDDVNWNKLDGPARVQTPANSLSSLPRLWSEKQRDAKPIELDVPKEEPKAMFPKDWGSGTRDDERDLKLLDGGPGALRPTAPPRGPGKGHEPKR